MTQNEKNIERILELCALAAQGRNAFTRADADELVVRVGVAGQYLPKKLNEIVSRIDLNYSSISDLDFRGYGARMERMISVFQEIKLTDGTGDIEEELLPTFRLDRDDRARVLTLCTEMRKIIFASTVFDFAHKRRLSNRVSAIERQVHQPNGLLDVILGGLSDVGEALGKFGSDVKPLTDRMSEVAKIARQGSKEYESLPPPQEQKRLPPPKE